MNKAQPHAYGGLSTEGEYFFAVARGNLAGGVSSGSLGTLAPSFVQKPKPSYKLDTLFKSVTCPGGGSTIRIEQKPLRLLGTANIFTSSN